ncbi:DUF551 domain-containing protein [Azotobacter beijerinckii]|uniref:DUF551 domain-containing protein n=1 Tax=Azotobacter beijerinckii TaxID=170623 RepID=A0A1I0Z6T7_9GAMM|nr:DUF551 domain-containing protein [Azotobacter beijerinckii]SFB20138.1 hypothetical protein SAMN04244571_01771 [Azotobacter beijerinckii]
MTNETTAPAQSLHDQIMRLPCTPPKDANVSQMLAYKSGHRDARHAAAELAAGYEADAQQAAPMAVPTPPAAPSISIEDMSRAAFEEAMAFGVNYDAFLRLANSVAEAIAPTPPARPVAVPDDLRAKAENFVARMRKGAEGDRAAERELEGEDADEAQACAVQAYIQEAAASMVEQLLAAAPTPPGQQGQWVPADSQIPTSVVLVWGAGGAEIAELSEDGWRCADDWYPVDGVTHWMPLPAAPGNTAAPEQGNSDEIHQIAFEIGGTEDGEYHFSATELDDFIARVASIKAPDGLREVLERASEVIAWMACRADVCPTDMRRLEESSAELRAMLAAPGDTAAPEQAEQPVKWGSAGTVGNLIAQLRTIDPAMPVYASLRVKNGVRDGVMLQGLIISYENGDGRFIVNGGPEKCVVIWTHPDDRKAEQPDVVKVPRELLERIDIAESQGDWSTLHEAVDELRALLGDDA